MKEPSFFVDKQIWLHLCVWAGPCIEYWLRFDARAILFLKTNLVSFSSRDVSGKAPYWLLIAIWWKSHTFSENKSGFILSIDVSEQAGLWIENWLWFDARTLIILVTTNIFIFIIFVSGQGLYWILIAIWWHLICLLLPRTTPSYMWQRGERQTCDLFCSFFENLTSATLIDWRLVLRKTGLSSSRMTDLSSFLSLREQKCNECCFQPSHEYFSKYVFSWISWICHSWSKVSTFAWLDMNWQSLLGNLLQPFHSEENLKSDIATESNSRYASGASWPWK